VAKSSNNNTGGVANMVYSDINCKHEYCKLVNNRWKCIVCGEPDAKIWVDYEISTSRRVKRERDQAPQDEQQIL
jgi:hypothetical protein